MKRLFLLIAVCMIGMVLPQGMWAGVTIDTSTSGKVVVTSEKAGDFAAYLNSASTEQLNALKVNEIVFVGKFNESDLSTLQSKGCATQKKVDMSEAKFIASSSSSTQTPILYHEESDKESSSDGAVCLVGGTLYQSATKYQWVATSETPTNNQYQGSNGWTAENINTLHADDYNENDFVKIATTANYYRLDALWVDDVVNNEAQVVQSLPTSGSYAGQRVKVVKSYSYWRLEDNNGNKTWKEANSGDGTFQYETTDEAFKNNETHKYNHGDLVAFPSSYDYKKWSYEWISINANDVAPGAEVKEPDWQEADRDNYKNSLGQPPVYIRFVTASQNYKKVATDEFKWVEQTYTNGDDYRQITYRFDSAESMTDPTARDQYAYVGGHEYVYNNGSWTEPQSSGDGNYDYTQMRFDYWGSNVEEIITSIHAEGVLTDQLCNNCSNLKTLTLSAGDFASGSTVLGNGVNSLETVNIKAGVTSLSAGMFNAKSNLSSVSFDEPCQITVLPENVFTATGITSITIPSSVEEIKGDAFHTCNSLKTVIIPENTSLNYIRTNAFQGCDNIEEVHVNVSPTVHPICCEYLAFGEYSLVGQTQSSGELDLKNSKMATLYFPKDDWDYYAGNWKLGMTCDSQDELNSIKDGCDPSKEGAERENSDFSGNNTDLNTSFTNQSLPNNKRGWLEGKSPANGWQQFARTSTGIDIIVTKGKYYRTYSTPSALVKPDWMTIYRVKEFNDGFTSTSNASSAEEAAAAMSQTTSGAKTAPLNITVTGTDDKAYVIIPENTGVIRVDERTSDALYYFLELERTSAGNTYKNNHSAYEYPYSESGDKVNYMFPTKGTEVTIGPVEKENGKIAYRIFGLLKQKTSGVSPKFSRAKVGTTLGDHRAYLKLPASVFHWSNEKVGTSQDATNNDVVVDENNTYAKISLLFDEDFEELNGGIATEIINSIEEDMYKNDSFYTLQGVKVAKPTTKGVYIHNGKKILIK